MKYKVVKRANPLNREESKFYAAPLYAEEMDIAELADDISDASTLNRADIEAVLTAFVRRLPIYLKKGIKVKLGDFGRIKLGFNSKGCLNEADVADNSIRRTHIIFTPSTEMRREIETVPFRKAEARA